MFHYMSSKFLPTVEFLECLHCLLPKEPSKYKKHKCFNVYKCVLVIMWQSIMQWKSFLSVYNILIWHMLTSPSAHCHKQWFDKCTAFFVKCRFDLLRSWRTAIASTPKVDHYSSAELPDYGLITELVIIFPFLQSHIRSTHEGGGAVRKFYPGKIRTFSANGVQWFFMNNKTQADSSIESRITQRASTLKEAFMQIKIISAICGLSKENFSSTPQLEHIWYSKNT